MSCINTNENLYKILQVTKALLVNEKRIFELTLEQARLKLEQALAGVRLMKYEECWDCMNYTTVYDEKDGVYNLPYKSCSCEEE